VLRLTHRVCRTGREAATGAVKPTEAARPNDNLGVLQVGYTAFAAADLARLGELFANDTHGVGLVTVTATRGDRSLTVNQVNVLHLRDGKVTEGWIASTDQQSEDEFWA
jgi:ketosteroid isomerase-like protein